MAQLAEQRSPKPQVGGSSPSWPASVSRQMNNKVKIQKVWLDRFVEILAGAILIAALWAHYYFNELAVPVRFAGWIVVLGAVAGLLMLTELGRRSYAFVREAANEMYKVVWPTRAETLQSTFVVIVVVAIIALIVWGIDTILIKIVSLLTN